MSAYISAMDLRKLLSVLIALAVLFGSAVTSGAAARAAVSDHQMQMMDAGHCQSMPSDPHDKSNNKSCCISVSVGVAAALSAPMGQTRLLASTPFYFVPTLHRPFLAAIATPPPRHS
jgi:hypothetical protein